MSRGHQQLGNEGLGEHHDPFAPVLGAGRGLKDADRAEQAQVELAASVPRAFTSTHDNTNLVSYFLHNDPATGVLHREDGPALIARGADGSHREEYWYEGQRHRADWPACILISADGTISSQEWFQLNGGGSGGGEDSGGVRHRVGGPALVATAADGAHTEVWYRWGQRHREDGPAETKTDADGGITSYYYRRDELHREDGPAYIEVWADGGSHIERYYCRGQEHRADGPAVTITYAEGGRYEKYYFNGELHRKDGPALIEVDAAGGRTTTYYRHNLRRPSSRLGRSWAAAKSALLGPSVIDI